MAKMKLARKASLPSAERILKWLEEANQFTRRFLSPQEILKWEKAKNLPRKKHAA